MNADDLFARDINRAIARFLAKGGTNQGAVKILNDIAARLLTPAAGANGKPVVVHTHKRGKPRVAPPAASKARMAKKQTITSRSCIKAAKQTLFQTFKLSDGTPIGEVSYSELPAIARRSDLDAMVCRAIYYHVTPTDQSAKVKELVSEDFLQHAIQSAKGERDALVAVVAA